MRRSLSAALPRSRVWGFGGFGGLGAGLGVKGFAVQELGAEGFRVCIGLSCFGMTT